ncbi:hypothetical protein M0802_006530 [Mischocyttarus mexicanus]|nr:hypothetical protein M0802_006530 [Mischocyttarus mexicanus]
MSNGCEIALNRTGWGACHYLIIGLCGVCTFVEAIASPIVFIVSRLAMCDLKLENNDIIIFNATQSFGVSWSLVPSIIRMLYKKFRPNSWRVLAGIGGVPSLIVSCAVSLLPETPRFLLYQQRQEEAIQVLRQIYAINNSKHIETYPVYILLLISIDLNTCIEPDEEIQDTNSFFKMVYRYCIKTQERIQKLFKLPFRRVTICSLFLCFLQFPGFIWLALWDAHLLQELGKKLIENKRGYDYTCNINFVEIAKSLLSNCQEINQQRFTFLSCISFSYLLGEVFFIIGIQIVKKKWILIFSSIVGGLAILSVTFVIQYAMQIILSVIFLASYAINHTIVNILIAENYPTGLRGTVMGFTRILPHLTAAMIKFISNLSCLSSIITASIILISAALIVIPMTDLTGTPMQERYVHLDDP